MPQVSLSAFLLADQMPSCVFKNRRLPAQGAVNQAWEEDTGWWTGLPPPVGPLLEAILPLSSPTPSWHLLNRQGLLSRVADVVWTYLCAGLPCDLWEGAATRWEGRPPLSGLQSDLPTPHSTATTAPAWVMGCSLPALEACSRSQSFALSCPQELLLPLTPTRLIALLCYINVQLLLHPKSQWMLIFYRFPIQGMIIDCKAGKASQLKVCDIPF